MNLTETCDVVQWPATFYAFVEKTGLFLETAPAAWAEAYSFLPRLIEHHSVAGYMSLYKMDTKIYRAGFALAAPPSQLPEGLSYELFPGGKYSKFVLTGPYSLLPQASGRVWDIVLGQGIPLRDDFAIENYRNDPRVTPTDQLITEILIPTA